MRLGERWRRIRRDSRLAHCAGDLAVFDFCVCYRASTRNAAVADQRRCYGRVLRVGPVVIPNPIIPSQPMRNAVNTSELLPCPFCGKQAKMIHPMGHWVSKEIGYGPDGSRITCSEIGCTGVGKACYGPDQDAEAIAAWNTRATPVSEPQPEAAAEPNLRTALDRQCDNMAFVINHVGLPDAWLKKFMCELDEDRAALATPSVVEEAVKADAWQDIATAPKDWSDVLLHDPDLDDDFRTVCEGYFDRDDGKWKSRVVGRVIQPTHWQPLPAPPARSATP